MANVSIAPIPYGSGGHYRVNARLSIIALQAANSRVFEVRMPAAAAGAQQLLMIPTRLRMKWLQTAAHTAAIEDSMDVFKCTTFSAVDSSANVALTPSKKRTSMAAPAAIIQQVTASGVAAGMAGGTLTKDTSSFAELAQWMQATDPTTVPVPAVWEDMLDDSTTSNGTHPWVFVGNEGFEVENRVLLGAAAGSDLYIDFSWAEVSPGAGEF